MIADSENCFTVEAEPSRQFSQRGTLVVGFMTKAGIDIVSDDCQMRYPAGIVRQILMDNVSIAIVARNQAKWGVRIFVNPSVEPGINPGDDFGQVLLDAGKDRSMGVCAGSVPFLEANVARVLVDMNLAFDQHQVIGLDFNAS